MSFTTKVYMTDGGDRQVVESGGLLEVKPGGQFDNAGAVDGATIVVGPEVANVRAVGVQLTDAQGNNLAVRQSVQIAVFADVNGDAFAATGGSTGIAIGTDGALLPLVAKKSFSVISEANGHIDLTWTDTGTEAAYLGVILPNGKIVTSAALTNT